ncbi:MAG: PAS domain S-box protein, partial [Bacteroidales bacterium]|nr:PAS domain S-box protein [Bacteroidales bacterium]
MDKDLKFIYINQVIFSMLGFTREEWMGSTLAEHCSVKELQHFMNIVEDELRKEDTYSSIFELNLFHKDGREVPLEVVGKILFDKKKEIMGFQGNARDITERKQAEEALKKKVNEFEIFNDAAVDRELIINEQRKEINELLGKLGKDQKYEIVE